MLSLHGSIYVTDHDILFLRHTDD